MAASNHCTALASPDIPNFVLSIFLVLGILASYIPQHYRIIARRSSEGLSPYFVLLGTLASTCTFANILVLPTSQEDIRCCKEINGLACFAALLGILQISVIWACFFLILLLFLLFFPRATTLLPSLDQSTKPSYTAAVVITLACIFHAVITFILDTVFVSRFTAHLQPWANFLGILATVLASVQYFPQIYTTWCLQTVGSLSIPMMCIQTPGSFVFAGSLAARLGWMGWSSWGLFVFTGLLQGALLGMCIWLEYGKKQKSPVDADGSENGHGEQSGDLGAGDSDNRVNEQTPLLDER